MFDHLNNTPILNQSYNVIGVKQIMLQNEERILNLNLPVHHESKL